MKKIKKMKYNKIFLKFRFFFKLYFLFNKLIVLYEIENYNFFFFLANFLSTFIKVDFGKYCIYFIRSPFFYRKLRRYLYRHLS